MQKIKIIIYVFLFTGIVNHLCAMTFAFNSIKPYDNYLWVAPKKEGALQIDAYAASSFNERGVWCDHTKICNVLQLFACEQDALTMLRGFDPTTQIGQFQTQFSNVPDDGIRGHLVPYATFHMGEVGISAQYWFPHNFCLGLYIPFMHMKLDNVCWTDLTKDITPADVTTKQLLTNDLAQNVLRLGGPVINQPWTSIGIGDIDLLVKLQRNFPQHKPILTNAQINAYLGISFPTGKRTNEDILFSLPFGYDGAPGILFGGALGLTWKNHFVGGVQLDLVQLMGNSRMRRIKTYASQTDLLLLAKTNAHIDWGFIQRYRLYLGAYQIMRGLSFDVAYQFQKQGDSAISLCGNNYITTIANDAQTLKFWTLHHIMFDLTYDLGYDQLSDFAFSPAITFFYQHAFRGQRALLIDKWGFSFSFNF